MLPIPLVVALAAFSTPQTPAAPPSIVLDARFDDWAAVQPTLVDPLDAPEAFVDLGEIRAAVDDDFVHLLIDFGRTINAQGLDGTADIILNADGDDSTGADTRGVKGADLIVRCTPPNVDRPDRPGRGVGIESTTYSPDKNDVNKPRLNPYDIGLAFAPTHAGRRIEFRLARTAAPAVTPATALPGLFVGPSFTGKVVFLALDGTLADETESFTIALPARAPAATTQAEGVDQPLDPLSRSEGAAFRGMTWNAELGAIISRPEPFIRTINALEPDVILLQELTDKVTVEQIEGFLAHVNPDRTDRPWRIALGAGGGDLRCAILSRLPIDAVQPLELVSYADRPERSVRVAAALLAVGDKRLLALSIHLKCCGRMGSDEDTTRLAEVELIRAALKTAIEQTQPDGMLIAGDFNLVGDRLPLENMLSGLDLDGSSGEAVDAFQIDGRSNATWAQRTQPFVPGRLDFAVFSDSSLRVLNSFVYDAWDIAPRWREAHGLEATDTEAASDHLPVVFDMAWKK